MKLPLINYFETGPQTIYIAHEQFLSRDGYLACKPIKPVTIKNHIELAELAIKHNCIVDDFVKSFLTASVMKPWRVPMGGRVPPALSQYQKERGHQPDIDAAINAIGATLTEGQVLYRGGITQSGVQTNALSTTFSPEIAINEAFYKGKANKFGILRIYVFTAFMPRTHVYVFRHHISRLGHEKEVLFASGATVGNDHVAKKGQMPDGLPYEIIEATIS